MKTFEQIYKEYYSRVKFMINKIVRNPLDAEELASETMIRVHKSLSSYKEDVSKLSTWIFNIAKHAAIDHIRKKKLSTVAIDDIYVDWANGDESPQTDHLIALKSDSVNPEERMIEDEVHMKLKVNFNTLNKDDQLIANLHYFEGLSYEEVAQEMNMPLGTIKAKLHRARVCLMEAFPAEMR